MKLQKKHVLAIAIVLAVFMFFTLVLIIKNRTKYETQEIQRCTITQVVEASGTVNPVNTVSVGPILSGLVKEIYVDFNSQVKKGQVLAELDPANFQAALEQASAQIVNAEAGLARLNAVTEMSKKTYTRYKNLYAKNFIAKSELDQAESDYLANLAQVNAQKAQIAQARANYTTAHNTINYAKIVSPVDGTVIARKIDVGQPVAASFQAPELFTIAQDLTKMQIEVNVSEADIGKVKDGQDVTYTLDGYPDSVFNGKVSQVRISPTTVSNVVTYSVIVDVDNEDMKLIPGMTANVSIITEKSENVLCVPNISLKFTPDTKGQKYQNQGIWILNKGKPKRIDIETGASDDNFTEVITNENIESSKVILKSSNQKSKKTQMRVPRL